MFSKNFPLIKWVVPDINLAMRGFFWQILTMFILFEPAINGYSIRESHYGEITRALVWEEMRHEKAIWIRPIIEHRCFEQKCTYTNNKSEYGQRGTKIFSEIPLLRPPKIKTSYLLKTLYAKFRLFFSSFSTPSVHLVRDHLWDCPKVVFKTTFGQSQRWS